MRLNSNPTARKTRFCILKEFEIDVCLASMLMRETSFVSDSIILSWYTLVELMLGLYILLFGIQLALHGRWEKNC